MKKLRYFLLVCSLTSISFNDYGQNKSVNEPCSGDSDCKSGHCVTVRTKDGEKKLCCDCDKSKLDGYTDKVNEKCKQVEAGEAKITDIKDAIGKNKEVYLVVLNQKLEYWKGCYIARYEREKTCWDYGDDAHKDKLKEANDAQDYITRLIDEKKRDGYGINCDENEFENIQDDIDDNCKGIDELFAKYGLNDKKEGSCRDLEDLIDKCIDCREAWVNIVNTCFRFGVSNERKKRLEEVKDMEKIAKETLEAKKRDNLCK